MIKFTITRSHEQIALVLATFLMEELKQIGIRTEKDGCEYFGENHHFKITILRRREGNSPRITVQGSKDERKIAWPIVKRALKNFQLSKPTKEFHRRSLRANDSILDMESQNFRYSPYDRWWSTHFSYKLGVDQKGPYVIA